SITGSSSVFCGRFPPAWRKDRNQGYYSTEATNLVGFRPRFFANFYSPAGAVPPCKTQPRGVYWGTAAWCRKKCAVPRRRDGSRRKIEYEIRQKRPLPDPAGAADRADAGDGKHLFG